MSKKVVATEASCRISDLIKNSANSPQTAQQRYILTGGPGAGKTSIIDFLAKQGYHTVPAFER